MLDWPWVMGLLVVWMSAGVCVVLRTQVADS